MHVLANVLRLCLLTLSPEEWVLCVCFQQGYVWSLQLSIRERLWMDCKFGLLLTSCSSEVWFFFPFFWRSSRMAIPVKGIRGLTMKFIIVQCVSKTFFASMGWSPTWIHTQIIHWGKRQYPESLWSPDSLRKPAGERQPPAVNCPALWFWAGS